MDGADAFAVPGNPWSLVRGYFSPATLFLLLNVVIGTIALTSRSHHRRRDDEYHQFHYAPPPPIARTSSMMERLRSLGLYRFRAVKKPATSDVKKLERALAQPRRVQRAPPRAPVVAAREVVEDAAAVSVDARADDFINRFRQQLQLQRLNSLLNYKEMLNSGL
ncbi:hypothetical protein QOZ80_1BG0080670 [Eleusine coracana subsp. coracana]|nr:hypothetical protein QOZ80_1BG0080670 [Eleusine coracana subsp. coracana]